jgi:hypothetical protein
MKNILIGLLALLVCGAAMAAQDTDITPREVRDPKTLETWLEANASDAQTRIAAVETSTTTLGTNAVAASRLTGNIAIARMTNGLVDAIGAAQLADGDLGDVSVASGVVTLDADVVAAAEMADADHGDVAWSGGVAAVQAVQADAIVKASLSAVDFGDFTADADGTCTLDADVVAAAEMADADHGDVSWSGGVATVDNVAAANVGARTEWTVDGKYSVVGGDASTGLMVLAGAVTSGTGTTETVTFAVAFGAAPIVQCTYTEDPGEVRPIFVTSVTASNFVVNITADMNFGYVAVGARP